MWSDTLILLSSIEVSFVDKIPEFQGKIEVFMSLIFIPTSFFMINLSSAEELFSETSSQRII